MIAPALLITSLGQRPRDCTQASAESAIHGRSIPHSSRHLRIYKNGLIVTAYTIDPQMSQMDAD